MTDVETVECPCGSGTNYDACCEPLIKGEKKAETAEQLMRSRYTAYAKVEMDYIFNTTHKDQRTDFDPKESKRWAEESDWQSLKIIETHEGGPDDTTGSVEFLANYIQDGTEYDHHEIATFVKEGDIWFFEDGQPVKPRPVVREMPKIGRNDPCHCGSGKKFKKCCMRAA